VPVGRVVSVCGIRLIRRPWKGCKFGECYTLSCPWVFMDCQMEAPWDWILHYAGNGGTLRLDLMLRWRCVTKQIGWGWGWMGWQWRDVLCHGWGGQWPESCVERSPVDMIKKTSLTSAYIHESTSSKSRFLLKEKWYRRTFRLNETIKSISKSRAGHTKSSCICLPVVPHKAVAEVSE